MGRGRRDLGQDFRSTSRGNYLIIFRYEGARFVVVRIMEGHRDLPAQLGRNKPPL
jgi:plasmid stabilization system protein ParE